MNPLDPDTLARAAADLLRLRRQFRRSAVRFLIAVVIGLLVGRSLPTPAAVAIGLLLMPFAAFCWLSAAVAQTRLTAVRCPRCGQCFGALGHAGPGGERCRHCDLDLGPATFRARAATKRVY